MRNRFALLLLVVCLGPNSGALHAQEAPGTSLTVTPSVGMASPESSVLSLLEAALVDYTGLLGGPTVNSPSRKGSSECSCGLRFPMAPMGHTSHFSPGSEYLWAEVGTAFYVRRCVSTPAVDVRGPR